MLYPCLILKNFFYNLKIEIKEIKIILISLSARMFGIEIASTLDTLLPDGHTHLEKQLEKL
jgi:hypothetical protein